MNIISNILELLLKTIFGISGDWGIAIIVLTLCVRVILLPVSLKQKKTMDSQQEISKQMEALKLKYKADQEKLELEMIKLSAASSKSMLGFMMTFCQLPVLYALYTVFTQMPMNASSLIVPWVSSIGLPDPYFIIPILTVLIQLIPSLLVTIGVVKSLAIPKISMIQVLISVAMACLFFVKAPVAVGLYWVASGLYTSAEQVIYTWVKFKKAGIAI